MNIAPDRQTPENRNIDACNPIDSIKFGRNFKIINEHNDKSAMQNDTPNSFKFCGIISPIKMYGSVLMPIAAKKMIVEKATIGI